MTKREIRIVAAVACTADDGCRSCGASLRGTLEEFFPEHAADIQEAARRWEAAGRPGVMGDDLTFDEEGWPL